MSDGATRFGRGLAFPVRVGADGRLACSTGADNVRESMQLILLTEARERLMLPQFGAGLGRLLFRPNTPATHRLMEETVRESLGRWEPRVRVLEVTAAADADDPAAVLLRIHYELVANQVPDRLDLSLTLSA
jgi:phage baseplate assembly protein W